MLIGTLGAFGSGVMLPISNVLFGDIMDELNGDPGNTNCTVRTRSY